MAEVEEQIRARFIDTHNVTPEQHLYALDPSKPLLAVGDSLGFILSVHYDRQNMIHGAVMVPKGSGDIDVFALALLAYQRLSAEQHEALTVLNSLGSPAGFDPVDGYFLDRVWLIERHFTAPPPIPRPKAD